MGHDIVGNGSLNKVLVDLIVGYLAGVVAVLVTGPLWLGEREASMVAMCFVISLFYTLSPLK